MLFRAFRCVVFCIVFVNKMFQGLTALKEGAKFGFQLK